MRKKLNSVFTTLNADLANNYWHAWYAKIYQIYHIVKENYEPN